MSMLTKTRAPRNRTIELDDAELDEYSHRVLRLSRPASYADIANRVINQDVFEALEFLPQSFADVLFVDPPYNLTKSFNSTSFAQRTDSDYADWFGAWFPTILRTLKPKGSVYVCADWRTSAVIYPSGRSNTSKSEIALLGNAKKAEAPRAIGRTRPRTSFSALCPTNTHSTPTQ